MAKDTERYDRYMRRFLFIVICILLVVGLITGACVGFTPTTTGLVMLKVCLIAFMGWCYSKRGWWT